MKPARATSAKLIAIYALAWLLVGSAINYAQAVVFATPYVWRRAHYVVEAHPEERLTVRRSWQRTDAWYSNDDTHDLLHRLNPVVPVRPYWLRVEPLQPSFGLGMNYQSATGWPLRNLTLWREWQSHNGTQQQRSYGNWQPTPDMRVSLIPLWPGFLLNALIWGFPVLLVPLVKGRRRARRRRRGLCARCGYDLRSGSLSTCPECGPAPRLAS